MVPIKLKVLTQRYLELIIKIVFVVSLLDSLSFANEFNLTYIEAIALKRAPELEQIVNIQSSVEESAIAEGTLKDPKLQAGLINIPTDTFSTTQENMTQIKFGVVQEFPRGDTLSLRSQKLNHIARSHSYKKILIEAEILRAVRMNYIELFYLISAKRILNDAKRVFSHLVKVATSTLSVGKAFQHDVFRAQLDLSEVERKLIEIEESIRKVRANLARYIGNSLANEVNPIGMPKWKSPKKLSEISADLRNHPMIRMEDSLVDASKKGVGIAEEQYKPAWSLGAHYSIRRGSSGLLSQRRSDFVGLQITTEMPFFTKNKQDRRVRENIKKHKASLNQRSVHLLNLRKEAEEYYASWEQLKSQEKLYKNRLVPEAKQYAEATLNAYENTQVDFPTVARAHDKSLMTRLQSVRIQTKRQKARAYILYLEAKQS